MNRPRRHMCWQSKRFYWERAPRWRAVGKGTQENCSAAWLEVLGFMVMGLVSGWSLANHSNSVFPGGACIAQPRWMLARGILGSERTGSVSFDLSWTLPAGGGLLVNAFLIRISCHKTTHANGYYGAWTVSVCFPNTTRDQTWVSCITGRFFTVWATREAHLASVETRKCLFRWTPVELAEN